MAQKPKPVVRKPKVAKRTPTRKRKPVRVAARRAAPRARPEPRPRKKPETVRLKQAAPSLTVKDIERSLAFYRDVLGFHVKERWEHAGALQGVELVAGAVTFYLGQDDWKKGRDRQKGEGFRIYCHTTQDVDALAATIQARGWDLDQPVADQPWGSREFAVVDPDGFKLTIAQLR